MPVPDKGKKAADFCLPDENKKEICLKEFRGSWVVLYFYPKDNTSGCTLEAIDFSEYLTKFESLNTQIIGISPDSPESHCKFREKHNLKIRLLSDKEHTVIEKYGAWVLKKNYGREYYGVQRSTFIINPDGMVDFVWPKVKVKGHVEDVLAKVKELQ
ncbi:peroxiredoxin [bacterium]|nr:peroxiredoxin [bacterium]